jgi:hypothetical protein
MFLTVRLVQLDIMELNVHQYAIFQDVLLDVLLQIFAQNVMQVILARTAKLSIAI